MKLKYCLYLLLVAGNVFSQDPPAYKVFTSEGKSTSFDEMLKSANQAQIIFVGELHNNPIAHWMELKVTENVYSNHPDLVLAMEMFEADNQVVLDEYLSGKILEDHLLKEAKIWNNYKTDYKPLIEFARNNHLPVIASNIPRRYANLVYRRGLLSLDSLSMEAKSWIAPLPIDVDLEMASYKNMIAMMGGHGGGDHPENIAYAQAVKDATMAYFILKNKTEKNAVIHFNGSYHSQDHEGIIWYLKKGDPGVKVVTIQIVEQDNINQVEKGNLGKADFIICVPSDMTKTY